MSKNNKGKSMKTGLSPSQATEYTQKKSKLKQEVPFSTSLSEISKKYAVALVNPFDGPLACVPAFPSVPSQKIRSFAKGFLSTGSAASNDFGFIVFSPFSMVVNDADAVYHSEASLPGTVISSTAVAGQVTGVKSNSPYVTADYGATDALAKFRLVAAGLRVRWAGTELNRGGNFVGFVHPTRANTVGSNYSGIDGQRLSRRFHPKSNNDWTTILYCPSLVNDLSYNTTPGSFLGHMCFVMKSPGATVSAVYEWEAYAVFEVNGRNIAGMSPSGADPAGLAVVHTVANNGMPPTDKSSSERTTGFFQQVEKFASKTLTEFAPKALDWALSKAPAAIDWALDAAVML